MTISSSRVDDGSWLLRTRREEGEMGMSGILAAEGSVGKARSKPDLLGVQPALDRGYRMHDARRRLLTAHQAHELRHEAPEQARQPAQVPEIETDSAGRHAVIHLRHLGVE